jgi:hypothetical protein
VLVNSWPLARQQAQAWLDGFFDQDYDLIPWGDTRPDKATLLNSKVSVEQGMQPWEVMIWKLQPQAE